MLEEEFTLINTNKIQIKHTNYGKTLLKLYCNGENKQQLLSKKM